MANLIKRIVKAQYETSDGQTFESKVDAMKHQADLDRVRKVMELVAAQLPNSEDSMQYLDAVTVNQVACFIVDNADALREILPKRAKSAAAPMTPEEDAALDAALAGEPVQGEQVGSPIAAEHQLALT
jgi:thymidine kinase